jgi:putative SOS response-associated peptidase YedK
MCRRFTLVVTPEVLAKTFDLQEIPQIVHRYNIAPGQSVGCIRSCNGRNELAFLHWGSPADESSSDAGMHIAFCADSENMNRQSAYAYAVKFKRCIIPATGFYEWKTEDSGIHPYYIRLLNSSVMGLAGVWEKRKTEDGTEIEVCCILTTTANDLVNPIHDRMPVIIHPEDYSLWLSEKVHEPSELEKLYTAYPSDLMFAHPVPNLVNIPRFDSPSCILQM